MPGSVMLGDLVPEEKLPRGGSPGAKRHSFPFFFFSGPGKSRGLKLDVVSGVAMGRERGLGSGTGIRDWEQGRGSGTGIRDWDQELGTGTGNRDWLLSLSPTREGKMAPEQRL